MFIRKRTYTRKSDGKEITKWRVVWTDEYCVQHEKLASTRNEAEAIKTRLLLERAAGTLGKPKPENPRLDDYYRTWIESKRAQLKPSSLVSYESSFRNHILPALGKKRLDDIRPNDLQVWINDLPASNLSPATIGRTYRYLRSCLKQAEASGVTHNNPCRGIMLPRVPRDELDYLKPSEISALLEKAPEPERYLYAVLAYSGLRLGEALALRWRDIDFEMRVIKVQRSYSIHGGIQEPKTASSRRAVPLLPVLAELLEPRRAKPDDLLFSKTKGGHAKQPMDPDNARKVFNDAVDAAGLKHVTMHSLRHSYATVMIASGASIKALQRALGHASAQMTLNTYSHLLEESMEAPVQKANSLFQGLANGTIVPLQRKP